MYPNAPNKNIIEKELSYKLVGIFYKIHKEHGRYLKERQYGDIFEVLLKENNIKYEREKYVEISGRKSNFIDFCINGKILIDLKAKSFITKEDYYQMQRYLSAENKELGLIVNFRQKMLSSKRVLNYRNYKLNNSENSDKFVV